MIHKYGHLLNTDRQILTIDQSLGTASTMNRESTNEMTSPKKLFPDIKMEDFTRKRTQAIRSFEKNQNHIDKNNNFVFTDSKMEDKLAMNTIIREPTKRFWTKAPKHVGR